MRDPIPVVNTVAFDARDPERLARFWGALLGVGVRFREEQFVWLDRQREGGFSLMFQQVPDPTPGKNKLHLDCFGDDLEAMTMRIEGLGGGLVDTRTSPSFTWNVYTDPEGNLFCVGHPAEGE